MGENHYVTPTYQSLLVLGLDTVAQRLMDGDNLGGWQALKTLFAELPPECQKECSQDLYAQEQKLGKINYIQGYTVAETFFKKTNARNQYLGSANLQLFNKFKNSLFSKGYLENSPTKPRNPQPTVLGETI
jgi:hypothetical protein